MCGDPGIGRVTAALAALSSGEIIEVICDNRDIEFTASAWSKKHGHEVLNIKRDGRESIISIRKGSPES